VKGAQPAQPLALEKGRVRRPCAGLPRQRSAPVARRPDIHAAIQQYLKGQACARLKLGHADAAPRALLQHDLADASHLREAAHASHQLTLAILLAVKDHHVAFLPLGRARRTVASAGSSQ